MYEGGESAGRGRQMGGGGGGGGVAVYSEFQAIRVSSSRDKRWRKQFSTQTLIPAAADGLHHRYAERVLIDQLHSINDVTGALHSDKIGCSQNDFG